MYESLGLGLGFGLGLIRVELLREEVSVAHRDGKGRSFNVGREAQLHGEELLGEGIGFLALRFGLGFDGFDLFALELGVTLGGDGFDQPESELEGEGYAVALEGGVLLIQVGEEKLQAVGGFAVEEGDAGGGGGGVVNQPHGDTPVGGVGHGAELNLGGLLLDFGFLLFGCGAGSGVGRRCHRSEGLRFNDELVVSAVMRAEEG